MQHVRRRQRRREGWSTHRRRSRLWETSGLALLTLVRPRDVSEVAGSNEDPNSLAVSRAQQA